MNKIIKELLWVFFVVVLVGSAFFIGFKTRSVEHYVCVSKGEYNLFGYLVPKESTVCRPSEYLGDNFSCLPTETIYSRQEAIVLDSEVPKFGVS